MIRPWYRSWLFWLGVPGAVFLIWMWILSMHRSIGAALYYHRNIHYLSIQAESGTLFWGSGIDPFRAAGEAQVDLWSEPLPKMEGDALPLKGGVLPSHATYLPADARVTWFPAPYAPESTKGSDSFDPFAASQTPPRVAIWAVLAVYLSIWIATLALWQGRKRRRPIAQTKGQTDRST